MKKFAILMLVTVVAIVLAIAGELTLIYTIGLEKVFNNQVIMLVIGLTTLVLTAVFAQILPIIGKWIWGKLGPVLKDTFPIKVEVA